MTLNYPQVQEYKIQWQSWCFSAQSQSLCRISSCRSFTSVLLSSCPLFHQEITHRDSRRAATYHWCKSLLLQWTSAHQFAPLCWPIPELSTCQSSSHFCPSKCYILGSKHYPPLAAKFPLWQLTKGYTSATYTLPSNSPKVPNTHVYHPL